MIVTVAIVAFADSRSPFLSVTNFLALDICTAILFLTQCSNKVQSLLEYLKLDNEKHARAVIRSRGAASQARLNFASAASSGQVTAASEVRCSTWQTLLQKFSYPPPSPPPPPSSPPRFLICAALLSCHMSSIFFLSRLSKQVSSFVSDLAPARRGDTSCFIRGRSGARSGLVARGHAKRQGAPQVRQDSVTEP